MNLEPFSENDRSLSCFFCRELFSLYVTEKLDVHRQKQVNKHVSTCASCRHLLDKIIYSQDILKELSKTHPTESLVNYIRKEQYFWEETFDKVGWRHWPSTLQWAVQLSLVAIILVTGIHFFPWLKVARRLHQIQKNAEPIAVTTPTLLPTDIGTDEESPKTVVTSAPIKAEKRSTDPALYGPVIPDSLREVSPSQATTTAVVPVTSDKAATGSYGPPAPPIVVAEGTALAMEPMREDVKSDSTKMAGFVWKGTLQVDKVTDELTAKVIQIVTSMGGVKAGQVELGWHRGSERYFHFILPEDSYDRLLSALNREGIVTLTKESHPRVIKQGHMRIIMTIEENE